MSAYLNSARLSLKPYTTPKATSPNTNGKSPWHLWLAHQRTVGSIPPGNSAITLAAFHKQRRSVQESGACILHPLLNHRTSAPPHFLGLRDRESLAQTKRAGGGAEAGRTTRLTRRAGGYPGAATRPSDPAWRLPSPVELGLTTSQHPPPSWGSHARPPLWSAVAASAYCPG